MSVLTNATKHFADQLTGDLKHITVPEWKTDVYFKPINNFATESRIIELTQKGKITEALVQLGFPAARGAKIAGGIANKSIKAIQKGKKFSATNKNTAKAMNKASSLNKASEVRSFI